MTVEALAEKIALAAEAEVVRLSHEVRKLEAQKKAIGALNAVLREENANMGLRLAAQQLAHLQERFDLSERMKALEEAQDRTGNIVQGLPTREEFDLLKNEHYALSYRVPV